MEYDETFLKSIPKFLRRAEEPARARRPSAPPAAPSAAIPRAAPPPTSDRPIAGTEQRPGGFRGASVLPPAGLAVAGPAPEARASGQPPAKDQAGVIDLARRRLEAPEAGAARLDPSPAPAPGEAEVAADDAAFQVTLPRSVIRQIRILAAQEGTTQRAIVLRALRLAGLSVPDGADIDRRSVAAKRRHHG